MTYQGKVVLITGAGSGIGAAVAKYLAQEGASLVLAGRRVEKLQAVAAECGAAPTLVVPTDVSSFPALQSLVEAAIQRFGRVDVLINNAGVGHGGRLTDLDPGEVAYLIQVNLTSAIWLTRLTFPWLQKSEAGQIVNISSMAGFVSLPNQTAYAASKAGIRAFGESLRRELAGSSITVTSVFPGVVESEMASPEMQRKAKELGVPGFVPMPTEKAARCIVEGMRRRRAQVFPTSFMERFVILRLERWAPWLVDLAVGKMNDQMRALMLEGNRWFRSRNAPPQLLTESDQPRAR